MQPPCANVRITFSLIDLLSRLRRAFFLPSSNSVVSRSKAPIHRKATTKEQEKFLASPRSKARPRIESLRLIKISRAAANHPNTMRDAIARPAMDDASTLSQKSEQAQVLPARPEIEYFANALDDCLDNRGSISERRSRVLKLVESYYEYASRRYQLLGPRNGYHPPGAMLKGEVKMDMGSLHSEDVVPDPSREADAWKQEAQIWDLLRQLLPIRYPDAETLPSRPSSVRTQKPTLWNEFVNSTPLAMERKAVLRWLQVIAADGPDINDLVKDLQKNADRGDIIAHGWIHTRSTIKLRKSVLAWPHVLDPTSPNVSQSHVNASKSPLVTQLDPDSTTRQGRNLEPQDEYFERAIWLGCFELLRRGCSAREIEEWCRERTEGWRAVSMTAIHLGDHEANASPDQPPEALALWMRACLAVARQGPPGLYERAVYGILGGDVPSVEAVCKTWEDFVFAHYNSLFRSQFDTFVLTKCMPEAVVSISQQPTPFLDPPQYHGESGSPERRFLRLLESNNATMVAARDPMKVLLASTLAKDLERYFFDQGFALALHANQNIESKLIFPHGFVESEVDTDRYFRLDHHCGLRVVSHIYIVLSLLEQLYPQLRAVVSQDAMRRDIQQNNIVAYVSLLRLSGLYELIPLYCSTLSESRQYDALCRNLIHIVEPTSRALAINLIGKAGLDSLKFVKTQAALRLNTLVNDGSSRENQTLFRVVGDNTDHSLKYGRLVRADFFGDDPDAIPMAHEFLIRTVEWLLEVDHAWPDALSTGTKIYKYFLSMVFLSLPDTGVNSRLTDLGSFLENTFLNSARVFARRISFSGLIGNRTQNPSPGDPEHPDFTDISFWARQLNALPSFSGSPAQVAADARNFHDMEALVRALDTMETLASLAQLSREYVLIFTTFIH